MINNDDSITTATGESYDKLVALGGVTYDNTNITEAKAIAITYFIENNEISKSIGIEDEMVFNCKLIID